MIAMNAKNKTRFYVNTLTRKKRMKTYQISAMIVSRVPGLLCTESDDFEEKLCFKRGYATFLESPVVWDECQIF